MRGIDRLPDTSTFREIISEKGRDTIKKTANLVTYEFFLFSI